MNLTKRSFKRKRLKKLRQDITKMLEVLYTLDKDSGHYHHLAGYIASVTESYIKLGGRMEKLYD